LRKYDRVRYRQRNWLQPCPAVAMAAYFVVSSVFDYHPVTFDNSWYAGYGFASLAVLAALLLYGSRISIGGRPLLNFSPAD